jgi:tRNA(His) 5'-end guanylyltransferase
MNLMDTTALHMCKEVQGAVFAYTQSDEVSILLVDFDSKGEKLGTSAWFEGNIQKLCSVGASTFTAIFNALNCEDRDRGAARFDCRVFTVPDPTEVFNYFIWRQQDATRNSIQASARYYYSDKECFKKDTSELQEMVFQKGTNWNDYPTRFKRGGVIYYDETTTQGEAVNKKTNEPVIFERPKGWTIAPEIPIFSSQEGRSWLSPMIPKMPELSCE